MARPAFVVMETRVVSGEIFVYGLLYEGEQCGKLKWYALKDYAMVAEDMAERDAHSERRMRELQDKINRA